jgi:hypothetical protein
MGPADENKKCRLESVVHIVGMPKNLATDGQNHRSVAHDQLAKGQFAGRVPSLREPAQELSITQPGHGPGCPENSKG